MSDLTPIHTWHAQGIDVSHFQGKIDWQSVARSIKFSYLKASEGIHTADQLYAINYNGAKIAGIPCGAYHFFHPEEDPIQQSDFFLQFAQAGIGDLPPMLDLEWPTKLQPAVLVTSALAWCAQVEDSTGIRPILYTSPSYAREQLGNDPRLADYKLWVAHYTKAAQPIIPKPWTSWTLWQYSGEARVPGISGNVDLDWLACDVSELVIQAPVS